jgi:hypothetical protein
VALVRAPGTLDAVTLPSGHLVLFSGMLDLVGRDPDLLAYLLGHEMAHVICRHLAERLSLAHFVHDLHNVLFLAAFTLLGDVFSFGALFTLLLAGDRASSFLTNRRFSRDNEYEADRMGLLMAAEAGFDVRKAPGLWRTVHRQRMVLEGVHPPEWCNAHPDDEHRRCGPVFACVCVSSAHLYVGRRLLRSDALEAFLPEVLACSAPAVAALPAEDAVNTERYFHNPLLDRPAPLPAAQ